MISELVILIPDTDEKIVKHDYEWDRDNDREQRSPKKILLTLQLRDSIVLEE